MLRTGSASVAAYTATAATSEAVGRHPGTASEPARHSLFNAANLGVSTNSVADPLLGDAAMAGADDDEHREPCTLREQAAAATPPLGSLLRPHLASIRAGLARTQSDVCITPKNTYPAAPAEVMAPLKPKRPIPRRMLVTIQELSEAAAVEAEAAAAAGANLLDRVWATMGDSAVGPAEDNGGGSGDASVLCITSPHLKGALPPP